MRLLPLAALGLALAPSGCGSMIRNGTIHAIRQAEPAVDTIGDYELARSAAAADVAEFERMHRAGPSNEDALFLLVRGWTTWGYAFASDDHEVAKLAGDEGAADYHRERAKLAYDRAIAYGLMLTAKTDEGFAGGKQSPEAMKAWLAKFSGKEDGEALYWLGSAWMFRIALLKDDPAFQNEAFVGIAMLERSRVLFPSAQAFGATSELGLAQARKDLLDLALDKTHHRALGVQLDYARLACAQKDQVLYEKMLNEIAVTPDPDATMRLPNLVAKRRARRALARPESCAFPQVTPTK